LSLIAGAISRFIKPKRFIADLLSRPLVTGGAVAGALLLLGAIVWMVRRRRPALAAGTGDVG